MFSNNLDKNWAQNFPPKKKKVKRNKVRDFNCLARRAGEMRKNGKVAKNVLLFHYFSFFLKNGPSLVSSSFIFVLSKKHCILQQINVKKFPSSIWCWASNPQPLEHECPPITARPGLPPLYFYYLFRQNSLPFCLSEKKIKLLCILIKFLAISSLGKGTTTTSGWKDGSEFLISFQVYKPLLERFKALEDRITFLDWIFSESHGGLTLPTVFLRTSFSCTIYLQGN